GRENIYLNGALLGMTTAEIKRKFDDIVSFSEVEQFLDTPVKRYSSGMYVRLAFAVAAHLDPEILIVDEVLAVGDAQFQKKCLDKMQDVASGGRTVVFVSHNMNAIRSLCQKAVLLEHGKMIAQGEVNDVVNQYLHAGGSQPAERTYPVKSAVDQPVSLAAVRVKQANGDISDTYQINEPVQLECDYVCHQAIEDVHVQFFLYDEKGVCVFMTADNVQKNKDHWTHQPGNYRSTVNIPANLLAESRYVIKLSVGNLNRKAKYVVEPDCVAFSVVDPMDGTTVRGNWAGTWEGAMRPMLPWQVTKLS
ncbi:MAG: ABC transporter ATP-binding protein, partial [Candidatus Kerfeldbacteria bacterium]|nr:ABC transporter ATP-binding protein [Candidatus Kerfeldbacteria bacterium]